MINHNLALHRIVSKVVAIHREHHTAAGKVEVVGINSAGIPEVVLLDYTTRVVVDMGSHLINLHRIKVDLHILLLDLLHTHHLDPSKDLSMI